VIQAFDLWLNESALSGESELVSADAIGSDNVKNILYSGTYVVKGEAEVWCLPREREPIRNDCRIDAEGGCGRESSAKEIVIFPKSSL